MTRAITPLPDAEAEVVALIQGLIQQDSTNFGTDDGPGEIGAAEYVQHQLQEVGIESELYHTTSGKRAGVFARIKGANPDRPKLLVHGHLDVVPAVGDWQYPAFGGEVVDDVVWGRGAVDMKDGCAMILAAARSWARNGVQPDRDINLLFLPDEEAGGKHGAHWLIENRKDIFEGVTEAVGEVGGFSLDVSPSVRLYMLQAAEKGIRWMKLIADGTAAHGSMPAGNNAVTELAETLTRIGRYEWPHRLTPTTKRLVEELSDAFGIPLDPTDLPAIAKVLGPLARMVAVTFNNTAEPTMLSAGYKTNVIPASAEAQVDGRVLPGFEAEFDATIDSLLGNSVRRVDMISDIALESPLTGDLVDAMASALRAEDPIARPIPYLLSGGTDAKAFARLGINCFGFIPLQLPPDLEFPALFHGVNERVPVASLKFGVRVMDRFLRSA